MKELLKYLIALIAIISMTGCGQDDGYIPDLQQTNGSKIVYQTVKPDTASVITLSRAMEIAAQVEHINPQVRSVARVPESVEAIADENGNPLMYVVNYSGNQGFVILSASKAYTPILAQSDEGRFDLSNLDSNHPVNVWLAEQKFIIQHVDALPDSIRANASSAWMTFNNEHIAVTPLVGSRVDYPDKPQVYYDSLQQWTLNPDIEVYTYDDYINTQEYQGLDESVKNAITVGMNSMGNSNYGSVASSTLVLRKVHNNYFHNQLTTTKWDQASGYEASIPYAGKRLGCTTVAAGQFMKFHKHPSYIKWNEMADNTPTKATTDFLYEVGKKMGIDYSSDSFDRDEYDLAYVLRLYGYIADPASSHDKYKVLSEVKKGNPVIMLGFMKSFLGIQDWDGHAWLCDGVLFGDNTVELRFMTIEYRPTIYSTPDLMIEAYKYEKVMSSYTAKFHFNWGWGGYKDGFYEDSDISVEFSNGEIYDFKHGRKNLFARPNPNI